MANSQFSRRRFIKGLGIAGGVSLLGSSYDVNSQIIPIRRRCPDGSAIIRKNIRNLTATELTAYKNGVAVMQSRPITDPTSWAYQAAIHGTYTMPVQAAWNSCQHDTMHFLSWHRLYLCFFERILRAASGMPSLGLPYWNYSDSTDPFARQLPAPFRTPIGSSNPLYVASRNSALNSGGYLAPSAVSLTSVLPGPTDFFTLTDNINGTPHGDVHIAISGWMSAFETAGQDPIFWLHHCNIDRLWNRWISGGGGRQNPTIDAAWLYTPFIFFDENGKQVKVTGADLMNPNCSMCKYCYDEETLEFDYTLRYIPRNVSTFTIGIVRKPIVLGSQSVNFEVFLNDYARESFARFISASAAGEPTSIKLNFEDVRAEKPLECFYEIYINLPQTMQEPNYEMDSYAGNASFFGANSTHDHDMGHARSKFSFYISQGIKNLSPSELNNSTLSITLIPTALVSENGVRVPIRSDAKASVGKITLSIEEAVKTSVNQN